VLSSGVGSLWVSSVEPGCPLGDRNAGNRGQSIRRMYGGRGTRSGASLPVHGSGRLEISRRTLGRSAPTSRFRSRKRNVPVVRATGTLTMCVRSQQTRVSGVIVPNRPRGTRLRQSSRLRPRRHQRHWRRIRLRRWASRSRRPVGTLRFQPWRGSEPSPRRPA
jgi:hypothetical protein